VDPQIRVALDHDGITLLMGFDSIIVCPELDR
jgi:hypothetical protein